MIKTSGDVAKGLIDTGGKMADKMLAKGGDFATGMMKLTSKLSDDIGIMADRILQMADKIGEMAERIERTEALMARLTTVLADKDLDFAPLKSAGREVPDAVVLDVDAPGATELKGPVLTITGDPASYFLYVSDSPLFLDGRTVVSRVGNAGDYDAAWRRSINGMKSIMEVGGGSENHIESVVIAVKTGMDDKRFSGFSNSVDIRINR